MSEQQQKNELTQEQLDRVAGQLDSITADANVDEGSSSQSIKQNELAPGDYIGIVKSSWHFQRDDSGVFQCFKIQIKGKMTCFGQNTECDWYEYGTLVKAFSLETSEFNVRMLLSLYRALGVKRHDGSPVCLGGDIFRTDGVPSGSWVSVWVKRGKDGSNYVAKLYPPRLNEVDERAYQSYYGSVQDSEEPQPQETYAEQTAGGEAGSSGGQAYGDYGQTTAQPYSETDVVSEEPPF